MEELSAVEIQHIIFSLRFTALYSEDKDTSKLILSLNSMYNSAVDVELLEILEDDRVDYLRSNQSLIDCYEQLLTIQEDLIESDKNSTNVLNKLKGRLLRNT